MAFINWGSETPEQLRARKRMEENMMFEQAAFNAATAAAAAGSGGRSKPNELVGAVDWLTVAVEGSGSEGHTYANFDEWTTATFIPIYNVKRLHISATSANAHVHSDLPWSDLTIQLYNRLTDQWVTVWSKRLNNPNHPVDDSADFFVNGIDVVFSVIPEVNRIRLTSTPGSDQTYHDWDQDSTIFSFYTSETH